MDTVDTQETRKKKAEGKYFHDESCLDIHDFERDPWADMYTKINASVEIL